MEFGNKFEGVLGKVKDGIVPLELTLSKITVNDQKENRVELRTIRTRVILHVKLGESQRVRWLKEAAGKQTCVQLTVEESR